MDIREKVKQVKEEVQLLNDEEKRIRQSIAEIKDLIEQKKKKESSLAELRLEEAKLLKELEG